MTNNNSKSIRLAHLLFYSFLPQEIKDTWNNLLPMMNQERLNALYNLLEEEALMKDKMSISQENEWKRLKLQHETQIDYFMKLASEIKVN